MPIHDNRIFALDPDPAAESVRYGVVTGGGATTADLSFADDGSRCTANMLFAYRQSPPGGGPEVVTDLPWAHLSKLARVMIGYAEVRTKPGPGGVKYISRRPPAPLPETKSRIGTDWLYARGFQSLQGVGWRGKDASGMPVFARARGSLTFTSLAYVPRTDDDPLILASTGPLAGWPDESLMERYVSYGIEPVDRTVTYPRGLLRWVLEPGDAHYGVGVKGPPLLDPIGRPEPAFDLLVTHHARPDLPLNRIAAAIGCVNATDFVISIGPPTLEKKAGTLLMGAPRISAYRNTVGDKVYDIQFRFRCVERKRADGSIVGWNHSLRNSGTPTLDFRQLSLDGLPSGDKPFRTYEFRDLFNPE